MHCPLTRYVEYAALPQGVKLKDGALTTRLKLAFVTENGTPRTLTVSGTARVDRLAIARKDDSSLVAARAVETTIAGFDLFRRSIVLDRVAVDAPEIDLRRFADGALELERLLTAPVSDRGQAAKAETSAAPWKFAVADARVRDGTLRVVDESGVAGVRGHAVERGLRRQENRIERWPGHGRCGLRCRRRRAFRRRMATSTSAAKSARGHFSLTAFRLAKLYPYYADALNLEIPGAECSTSPVISRSRHRARRCSSRWRRARRRSPIWRWRCAATEIRCGAFRARTWTASPSISGNAASRSKRLSVGRGRSVLSGSAMA